MKTNSNLKTGSGRILRGAVATAALLLLSGFAAQGQTPPPDPTTVTWDCVMSGPREGLAYITFAKPEGGVGNGRFSGFEIMVPKQQHPNQAVEGRNPGGDSTRTGTTSPDTNSVAQQIFGSQSVGGPWNFDSNGRVVGYFIETSTLLSCVTNAICTNDYLGGALVCCPGADFCVITNNPNTNDPNPAIISYRTTCTAITNTFSFVGRVVPGKRLTLVSSTPFGHVTYKGVPASASLPDLRGSWLGVKKQAGVTYNEFFTLAPSVSGTNIYDATGAGPGYSYTGVAILSSQKKIAFEFGMNPEPSAVVRAVVGPFNSRRVSGTTHGWDQPDGLFINPARFDVTRPAN